MSIRRAVLRNHPAVFSYRHHGLLTRAAMSSKSTSNSTFRVALKGDELLATPRWNKGSAFTERERVEFDLTARLPFKVNTLEEQCERAYAQLQTHENPIRKNGFIQSLKAQNWVLHYSLLMAHLSELIPIIYTPTEAEAISGYSQLFRRSEGLYLTYPHKDRMEHDFLDYIKGKEIDLVVCSDSEAILGIGDQGVGGIGISTAKCVIYSLTGGIDPSRTLPIVLDVGTNNEKLLEDHLYVGWREKRVRGDAYDEFMDTFVQLVRKHLPNCLLHFEDFGLTNAQRLLNKYRDTHAVFNDDIQGTGAVTLAALMSGIGVTKSKLSDQRIIVYGAGSAGLGITRQIRDAMVLTDSISHEDASSKFWLLDKEGLVKESLGSPRPGLEEFVKKDEEWKDVADDKGHVGLLDVVKRIRPTVLIGVSTAPGAFSEDVVKEMAKHCERPIIFPLSNPSRLVEVDPKDANEWTNGKALLATGSPFPPAKMPNGKDYIIGECNNALVYPGLGLGAIVTRARSLTDTMLIAGTKALAALSPALKDPTNSLLPDFADSRAVNLEVAVAVAEQAFEEGVARVDWAKEEVRQRVQEKMWEPVYGEYVYDPKGEV